MKHLIQIVTMFLIFSGLCLAEPELLLTRISLDEATNQIIIKDNKSKVLGAHTEIIDGKEVHIIKVLTSDGHIRHFRIDAETGNLIN